MRPITFQRRQFFRQAPGEIAAEFADVNRWKEFEGYGLLPGIAHAEYETRTPHMIGSRVRVHNRDGSQHVEDVVDWQPDQRIVIKLHQFTPPLSRLASHVVEEWTLAPQDGSTLVTRSFQMYPTSALARLPLWLIARLFSRAVAVHLAQIAR